MKQQIALLGSTGSIGRQALDIIRLHPEQFEAVTLTSNNNWEMLANQAAEFLPDSVVIANKEHYRKLSEAIAHLPVKVYAGEDALCQIVANSNITTVVNALVGYAGLEPTLCAIEAGKKVALANKETLVTAGHIIIPLAKETGVKILPVDSEHSAIFQCLNGEDRGALHKILLTASGGPFRGKKREELQGIQVEDALKHPNWAMGRKITIDSSTLVNKGLEMMEARWLFGVEPKDIQIVVQPKSIIHSMVEFVDGAVIAQLGTPDMKLPIQYALYYPQRRYLPGERLDFGTLTQITFEKPDMETFTGLKLAFDAAAAGGSMPTVYNAANEKAVALFLDRKIGWLSIPEIIEASMGAHPVIPNPSVEEILETEQAVYEFIESRW